MATVTAIRSALAQLQPEGVLALEERPGTNRTPIWSVTTACGTTSYCCSLEQLVKALTDRPTTARREPIGRK
jgi:hypothetical protein